jgi:hypothetical protein
LGGVCVGGRVINLNGMIKLIVLLSTVIFLSFNSAHSQKSFELAINDFWKGVDNSDWQEVAINGELIIEWFENSERTDTTFKSYYLFTAIANAQIAQFSKAESQYLRLIHFYELSKVEISLDYTAALSGLALVYSQFGQFSKSILLNEKCLEIIELISGNRNTDYLF